MSLRRNHPTEQEANLSIGAAPGQALGQYPDAPVESAESNTILGVLGDIEVALSNIQSHKHRLLRVARSMGVVPTPIEKDLDRGSEVSQEPAHLLQRLINNRVFVRSLSDELGFLVERLEDNFQ